MTTAIRLLFSVLIFVAFAGSVSALEVPPAPTRWVTDQAGILQSSQVIGLDQKLEAFEKRSGTQFLIYIFPSLEDESLEEFTVRAATKWRVGQAKYDNGLVLFVFQKERKVRIEVGYGREGAVTDAKASRAIREYLAPHFQRGDYGAGLNAAADFLISTIEKTEPAVPMEQQAAQGNRSSVNEGSIRVLMILAFIFFFFILPSLSRRRSGGCGGCIIPMFPMGGGGFTMGGGGFGGGGGFSGGGGSFGGGGASGGW